MEWLTTVFSWILFSSFTASILGISIMLVKIVFKNKISSRAYYILWLLVFVKLIVGPFVPASAVSIFNFMGYERFAIDKNNAKLYDALLAEDIANKKNHLEDNKMMDKLYADDNPKTIESEMGENTLNSKIIDRRDASKDIISKITVILGAFWALGVCLVICIAMTSAWLFTKKLKGLKNEDDERLLEIIKASSEKFNITRDISIFISPHISSPCILGILRPRIVLPKKLDSISQEHEIAHIIMHELAHFKRKDNLTNFFVIIAQALHWFNPIVWYIASQIKLDRELSCDAYVLEKLGQEEAVSYGMTLIKSIQLIAKKQPKIGLLNFYDTQKQIERRIKMIKGFKKGNYKLSLTGIIVFLIISFITLTNADTNTEPIKASPPNNMEVSNKYSDVGDEKLKFKINRQHTKRFNSLQRAMNFIDFDFKVPDFIPEGYRFDGILLLEKELNNEDVIHLYFLEASNNESVYSCKISKSNLLNERMSSENESCQKEAMSIGKITGTLLTAKPKGYSGKLKETIDYIHKYFIWQDNGIWYDIHFSYVDKEDIILDIAKEDLTKIVQSMKKTLDIKNAAYVESDAKDLNIYDETDLKKAEELLGFKAKFPLELAGGYSIFASNTTMESQYENRINELKSLNINYFPKGAFRMNAIEFDSKLVVLRQMNDTAPYDLIKERGFVTASTEIPDKSKKIMAKSLRIKGIDVYSLDGVRDYTETYRINEERIFYIWKENDRCYMLQCAKNISNKQEIIKQLILEKP